MLTHGHEDHIGATPYLLRERGDIPLVGSRLTLALLTSKLREHRLRETVHHQVKEGDRISFGPFDLEFVAVNHSIPDALAVAIRTGAGLVLHTGDFKMDQARSTGGSPTCAPSPGSARRAWTCSWSTPPTPRCPASPPPRRTSPRSSTGSSTRATSGSSCLLRLARAPRAAGDGRRRGARPEGRLRRPLDGAQLGVARELGYLNVPPDTLVDAKGWRLPAGEDRAHLDRVAGRAALGLSRIAQRNCFVHIEQGDTVVLASSLIGNENAVYRVINGLSRWGERRAQGQRARARLRPRVGR